jgi:hypothetical protein
MDQIYLYCFGCVCVNTTSCGSTCVYVDAPKLFCSLNIYGFPAILEHTHTPVRAMKVGGSDLVSWIERFGWWSSINDVTALGGGGIKVFVTMVLKP